MADSVIGSLRVLLGLDTAAFTSGVKEAESSLGQFSKGFQKAIGGLAIGAVAVQFSHAIKGMIDEADNLNKASQKFGVPVEQLSALKYAAELADVSFEALGKGLGKLSKAILDGATNPAGDAAKSFQALGVSLRDANGQIKPTQTVFTDIAEKFSTMEDGATKTALAIRIFGRAGAELIPLLNAGRAGIKQLTDEAKALGIVISTETAAKAEEFNDTLKRLDTVQRAAFLMIAESMLPALQSLANAFLNATRDGEGFKSLFTSMADTFKNDIQDVQKIALAFENLARILIALKNLPSDILDVGITQALKNLDAVIDTNRAKVDALHRSFLSLGESGAFEGMDNLAAILAKVARGYSTVNEGALTAKNAVDQFIISQQKSQAQQAADTQTAFAAIGVREALRVTMEAEAIAAANNIVLTDKQREALKLLSDQAGMYAVQIAGVQMTQQNLQPYQAYQQELAKINQLLAAQAISAEVAQTAGLKAAAAMAEAYGSSASAALGGFSEFFKTFGKGNKEAFAIAKAFAISQAIVNTYVAATKALSSPPGPPVSYAYVAGAIALGLAQVAKIAAEKPPAMATGGMVSLGAGGIDSQLIPIAMSPGEKVNVEQNKYGEGASAKTITIGGINAKEYYRGDLLRDLIDNINEAISDGYKLKVA